MQKERIVKVGLLGLGNIGTAVWQVLIQNAQPIAAQQGVRFQVKRALVKDIAQRARYGDVPVDMLSDSPADILDDPEIEIVGEFMGGVHPAREYLLRALENGKTVVTANKEVLAKCAQELDEAAAKSGASIYFEATAGGGVPIVRALKDSLQANHVTSVMGIINGTTNYILSNMDESRISYDQALADAMQKGLAEPDPTADVEGWDAAYKLSILSGIAFHRHVPIEDIHREGITRILPDDIDYGRQMGLTLKLLAIGKYDGTSVEARVHPTFIPASHPLASVRGSYNAVLVRGDAVEDLMFYGRGAGGRPTASAIISDMVQAATKRETHQLFMEPKAYQQQTAIQRDWRSEYFVRVDSLDQPGVLARVAEIFGRHGVSLARINQTDAPTSVGHVPVIFLTHTASELSIRRAVDEIDNHSGVGKVGCIIRVERNL